MNVEREKLAALVLAAIAEVKGPRPYGIADYLLTRGVTLAWLPVEPSPDMAEHLAKLRRSVCATAGCISIFEVPDLRQWLMDLERLLASRAGTLCPECSGPRFKGLRGLFCPVCSAAKRGASQGGGSK